MPPRQTIPGKSDERETASRWWHSTAEAVKRELIKRWAQFLLFLVLSVLAFGAYRLGFSIPSREHLTWQRYVLLLIRTNWAPLVEFIILATLIGFLVFFIRKQQANYKQLKVDSAIKRDVGLVGFFPVSRYGPAGDQEIDVEMQGRAQEQIITATKNARDVDMILVSGYKVLGTIGIPGFLSTVLREKQAARYRVMLLDPTWRSPGLEERAQRIGKSVAEYLEGLRSVLEYLALLQLAVKVPVKVWLYQETPTFQMFKTANVIWVQTAVAYRTEDSPLCGFEKSPYSLYWALERFWDRMWDTWGGEKKALDLTGYFPRLPTH